MESEMDSFGVVPKKILGQLAVEDLRNEQVGQVIINKLFLQGPVESFQMSVHFGSLGISMIMS